MNDEKGASLAVEAPTNKSGYREENTIKSSGKQSANDEYLNFDTIRFYSKYCGGSLRSEGKETLFKCPKCSEKVREIYVSPSGKWNCKHANCAVESGCSIQAGGPRQFLALINPVLPDREAFEELDRHNRHGMTPLPGKIKPEGKLKRTWKTLDEMRAAMSKWSNVSDKIGNPAKITGTWNYFFPDGKGAFIVFRLDGPKGKIYMQAHPVLDGWQTGGLESDRPLYRLNELPQERTIPVFVTEGEKCADTLHRFLKENNVKAWVTTPSQGAKSPQKTVWFPLAGRSIIIFPDNDKAGNEFSWEVARLAAEAGAAEIKITKPFGIPESGFDVADLICTGVDDLKEIILKAINEAEKVMNTGDDVSAVPQPVIDPRTIYNPNRTTDMGNSERFFELAGNDIRFVKSIGWHIWKDGRWVPDEMAVRELFKEKVVSRLYQELSEKALIRDQAAVKELAAWSKRTEADRQIQGGLDMTMSMKGIYIQPSDLDRDPWLLNVQNGTIELKTGKLREHRREDVLTKMCPVVYDQAANAPIWEKFLFQIMSGKQELIDFLRRAVGYSLTGSVQAHCWFIAYGVGANGKGTFLNTLLSILGNYGTQAAPDLLMMAKGEASKHPTEQADLFGKRLAVCQETEEGRRLAEVAVKQMTGGDRIKARLMRKDFFEFEPTHKLWLATNHRPVIKDTTISTWRRIRPIPFSVVIPESDRDDRLSEKLKSEFSGILSWAVRGCLEWQKDGLKPPAEVIAATQSYRESQDVLAGFLAECCIKNPLARVESKNLYGNYLNWCEANKEPPKKKREFDSTLIEKGFSNFVGHARSRQWNGIGLKISYGENGEVGEGNRV